MTPHHFIIPPRSINLIRVLITSPFFIRPSNRANRYYRRKRQVKNQRPFHNHHRQYRIQSTKCRVNLHCRPITTMFTPYSKFKHISSRLTRTRNIFMNTPNLTLTRGQMRSNVRHTKPFMALSRRPFTSSIRNTCLVTTIIGRFTQRQRGLQGLPSRLPRIFRTKVSHGFRIHVRLRNGIATGSQLK